LEEKTTTASTKTAEGQKSPLDAFQFLAVAKEHYTRYTFLPDFVDGFVQEILQRHPDFTGAELSTAFKSLETRVERYKSKSPYPMNPYTLIRHVLFLSNQEKFALMLFDRQRANFLAWLEHDHSKA